MEIWQTKIHPSLILSHVSDENEFLRLKRRLEFSNLSLEESHLIILSKHSLQKILIMPSDPEKMKHPGTAETLSKIHSRYWTLKERQVVKSFIKKCLVCKKEKNMYIIYHQRPTDQITEPFPGDTVNELLNFSVCGLD